MRKILINAIVAGVLFTGCSQKDLENFNNLNNIGNNNTNNKKSNNDFLDLSSDGSLEPLKAIQNDMFSKSGLLPVPKVGLTYFHTPERKGLYPIGYGNDISFYITGTIDNNFTDQEILSIRDDILKLIQKSNQVILDKIDKIERKTIVNNDNKKDDVELSTIDSLDSYKELENFYLKIAEKINKYGIYIHSWKKTDTKNSANDIAILKDFFVNKDKDEHTKQELGFSIYSGLKISNLFIGSDMIHEWDNLNDNLKNHNVSARVATTVVHTKKALPVIVSDTKSKIKNALQLKLENLFGDNKDDLLKKIASSIALDYQNLNDKINSLSTVGFSSNISWKAYQIPTKLDMAKFQSIQEFIESKQDTPWQRDGVNNWQTIYYVDTDVEVLRKWFKDNKPAIVK